MRLLTFSTLALLSAGLTGQAVAQDHEHDHDHGDGAGKIHSHLQRVFQADEADEVAEAPEAPEAPEVSEALAATPAKPAKPVAQEKERGFIGVNMSVEGGAMVIQSVIDGTPAAKAKLEAGDRVTAIQGEPVKDQASLTSFLGGFGPGETVRLTVERNGWTKEIDVTLASRSKFNVDGGAVGGGRSGAEDAQRGEIREKIRRKLDEKERKGSGSVFFGDSDSDTDEHREVEVEMKREGSGEPEVRVRINGEEVDLEDLEELEGAEGIFVLKDLEGAHGDGHVIMVDPEGRGSWTDKDGNRSIFLHRGDHGEDHDHDEMRFGRGRGAGGDEVQALRDEMRELRRELAELRRERLAEIDRLRKEVKELLRSVERGR